MEKERLTNADIGRELDLPESTVRYYRDRFEEFLPMVGEGRQRRYRPEAMEVFRVIADTLRNNGTADEAQDILNRMFPRNSEPFREPQQQVAVPQQQVSAVPLEAFQALRLAMETQAQQLQGLSNEVRQLRDELARRETADDARAKERDVALVATMRRLLEAQRPQTFWQRLFGRKSAAEAENHVG